MSDKMRKRLEELASRSSCTRRQVAAVALVYGSGGEVVAEGWNMEREGLCATDCPRARSGAVPGVSSYDQGPTSCIAIHAEDMVVRTLLAKGIPMESVYIVSTEDPCYKCKEMFQRSGLSWQVFYL